MFEEHALFFLFLLSYIYIDLFLTFKQILYTSIMSIVIVGSSGLLGQDIFSVLSDHYSVVGFNSSQLDYLS